MSLRRIKDLAVRQARAALPEAGWLDTHAAAAYLSLTRKQLEHWRSSGGGPPYAKIGRHVRYRRAELDAWMSARGRTNTASANLTRPGAAVDETKPSTRVDRKGAAAPGHL